VFPQECAGEKVGADATVSNRRLANMLGVSHTIVNKDTGNTFPPDSENARDNKGAQDEGGNNFPPGLSGADAAALIERRLATMLGVSDMTIGRDLATNVAPASENTSENKGVENVRATNVAPGLALSQDERGQQPPPRQHAGRSSLYG
jgi:hypothetical protein